jgi:drug/metabolite transporter (DMT)-like permease
MAESVVILHHHLGFGFVSVVLLSLASAASYGVAAALQHRAVIIQPQSLSRRPGLLLPLLRRPIWLVGNLLDGVGYLFQFLALRRGSLPLVEPLLVTSLAFAIPVAAWLDHRRVTMAELGSSGMIAVGLALFMVVARPGAGHPRAPGAAWMLLTITVAGAIAVMMLCARRGPPARKALLLAAGAGAAFGYVAALTERTGHLLDAGVLHTLMTWEPYALVAGCVAALFLTQTAFHAGPLRLSLPMLTITQPLVAVAIGIGIFGERVASSGAAPALEVVGLVLLTVGVFSLARSPVIPELQSGTADGVGLGGGGH